MIDLSGKTCFVTAAGQGIGRASALAMIEAGAQVIAADINEDALADLAGMSSLRVHQLDVTDRSATEQAAAVYPEVDVLFNCAGKVHHGALLDCDEDAWEQSVALNMTAMYRMCRSFLPRMVELGGGSIINMASVVSNIVAAPNRFVYGATKAGVIGMTKSIAADYVGDNIRCNAICPGTVESPSWHDRVKALGEELGSYEEAMNRFVSRQPMGRVGKAEEIASFVVYLASDASSYTTGAAHVIDGAWSNH